MAQNTIARKIVVVRGQRVMLARDLAILYEVTTGNLNLAVRRNALRFPPDFMFQLAMLSSVLRSKRAILAKIEIMRTFSRFREVLSAHKISRGSLTHSRVVAIGSSKSYSTLCAG